MSEQAVEAAGDMTERGINFARDQWGEIMGQTEDFVRANPTKALLYGVAAGFVIDRLPIFRLFGFVVRLLLLALKPALFVFGAMKIYQATQQQEE
jgi:hypothetical protein